MRFIRHLIFVITVVVLIHLLSNVANLSHSDEKSTQIKLHCRSSAGLSPNELKYISLCNASRHGNHRTGNHLFMLAAMVYLSEKTGRRIIMHRDGWCLDQTFLLNGTLRFSTNEPPQPVSDLHPPGIYNDGPKISTDAGLYKICNMTQRTLCLCGLYQTFYYADAIASTLRSLLNFRPDVRQTAGNFLDNIRPAEWQRESYFVVGIHMKRRDFSSKSENDWAHTVASEQYLNNSMNYFLSRHHHVQFIVATDDIEWSSTLLFLLFGQRNISSENLSLEMFTHFFVNNRTSVITFSVGHTAAVDLAILSSCDAVIQSTGSFSWWAAWLVNKTAIYRANVPYRLDTGAHFPVRWIPMT